MESLLSTKQIAAVLNVDIRSAQRIIANGRIPAKNVGSGHRKREWRVRLEDLQRFIATPDNAPTPPVAREPKLPPHVRNLMD